jgi:DNA polymerase-3 subunit epsilon
MFAIIDVETTGSIYKYGKLTEIAMFLHDGQKITGSFQTLINPEMDIPFFITRLTGIDNEMVRNAPRFYEVARQIVELTAGRIFVAHNASFDYKFIKEEYNRLGYEYIRKTLCTVKLARRVIPGHKSYSLGNLCTEFNIENLARHRAAGDALATTKLFEILLEKSQMMPNFNLKNQYRLF